MTIARIFTRASVGIEAPEVVVEAHISNGLPAFSIVGLPETTVRESRDRVRSALINSRFEFPARRITINLAPADLPKEGGRFDLAIALSILTASGQLESTKMSQFEFLGELALNGELRPVSGILPAAIHCALAQRSLVVPKDNEREAALPGKTAVYAADHLLQVVSHLNGQEKLPLIPVCRSQQQSRVDVADISEVKGQQVAKRALEIAASGGHNLLMVGSPGAGKTLLASRYPGLLPELNKEAAMQVAAIHSVADHIRPIEQWLTPPYRAPHHTASAVALVGGGSNPKPGEISLAHQGVLFLDELPEFERKVLEVLREPLEAGKIVISRAARQVVYPASFQLIAAMNPCQCGLKGHPTKHCRCSPDQVKRYRNKISGPLLDRIDLHINVQPNTRELMSKTDENVESSEQIRTRVVKSRERQYNRQGCLNSELSIKRLEQVCQLNSTSNEIMRKAIDKLGLSGRAYHRIIKIARTIADMVSDERIESSHIMEAIGYRQLDRETE